MAGQVQLSASLGGMSQMEESARPYVLVCERIWLYRTLTAVAGFFGAFTYLLVEMSFATPRPGMWC